MIAPRKKAQVRAATWSLILSMTFAGSTLLHAQDQTTTPPDNSAQNKHHNMTADQQANTAADREMASKIRKSVMADKSLSTYAHNIKIISVNGTVTLKGPVKSADEKSKVADIATTVAGSPDKVVNDLTVKETNP